MKSAPRRNWRIKRRVPPAERPKIGAAMKRNFSNLSRRYAAALRAQLQNAGSPNLKAARELGGKAVAAGLSALDLARVHEKIVGSGMFLDGPPAKRAPRIKQAGR